MLFEPKTDKLDYRIDTMVFKLPETFGYPSVKKLDKCKINGKNNYEGLPCNLNRVYTDKYVTFIPDGPTTY